jgi:hypothetical protein
MLLSIAIVPAVPVVYGSGASLESLPSLLAVSGDEMFSSLLSEGAGVTEVVVIDELAVCLLSEGAGVLEVVSIDKLVVREFMRLSVLPWLLLSATPATI